MTGFRQWPHKSVLALAWPMILSNISVPLLGIVDTAILGHLPSPVYLSAVALGASLMSLIFWSFGFLRMGTTSLTAQAFGQKNNQRVDSLLIQSLTMAMLIGLALALLREPVMEIALQFMQPSEQTLPLANQYGQIRLLSAPLVLANLVMLGWFIGCQNTRAPLLLLVSTNLVNLVLDMVFIWGFGLNSEGAAWATVCADCFNFALGAIIITRSRPHWRRAFAQHFSWYWRDYRPLLLINRHLFVRTLCLLFALAFFNAQSAQMGDVILATNAIVFQLLMFTAYGLDGIAHASEALVGASVGSRQPQQTRRVIATTGFWSFLIASCMALSFAASEHWLITFFTDIELVQKSLASYSAWIIALPLLCVAAFWLDGVFIGSGHTNTLQNTMLFSVFCVFFPAWYVLQPLNNHGLWLAFSLLNLSRGMTLAFCLPRLWQSIESKV